MIGVIESKRNGAYIQLPKAGPDRGFQRAIVKLLPVDEKITINDLGCGAGDYVAYFNLLGWCSHGYDGNSITDTLIPGFTHQRDFTQPQVMGADVIMSLEVGEHIPKEFEQTFLDTVAFNAKSKVILSWAVPGQGGPGHVNEQPVEYIVDQMRERGWIPEWQVTASIRKECFFFWLRNNLVVYSRK